MSRTVYVDIVLDTTGVNFIDVRPNQVGNELSPLQADDLVYFTNKTVHDVTLKFPAGLFGSFEETVVLYPSDSEGVTYTIKEIQKQLEQDSEVTWVSYDYTVTPPGETAITNSQPRIIVKPPTS